MKQTYKLLFIVAWSTMCTESNADSFWFTVEDQKYSEIASIDQTTNSLVGNNIEVGDHAFAHTQIEIGERIDNWEMTLFSRADVLYEFHPKTAEYIYLANNNLIIPDGAYPAELSVNAVKLHGIGSGWHFTTTENIQSRIRVNYLYGYDTRYGALDGNLEVTNGQLSGNLDLDYAFSKDQMFGTQVNPTIGHGYSVDFYSEWHPTNDLTLTFDGKDILSAIYWKNQRTDEISTVTRSYPLPTGGALDIPGLVRRSRYEDVKQILPSRINFKSTYHINETHDLSAIGFWYGEHFQPTLAYEYNDDLYGSGIEYNVETSAIGLSARLGSVKLYLASDSILYDEAKAINLGLSINYAY